MERATEPMEDAPSRGISPTRKWVKWSQDLWSAGALFRGARQGHWNISDASRRESLQGSMAGIRTGYSRLLQRTRGSWWNLRTRPRCRPSGDGWPGKFRPLGIPTLKDRLVRMALKLVLEPIFEADFYPISYGFRPGRSTHDALARVRHKLNLTSVGASTPSIITC